MGFSPHPQGDWISYILFSHCVSESCLDHQGSTGQSGPNLFIYLPIWKVLDKYACPLESVKCCYSLYCLACLICKFLINRHRITSILQVMVSSVPNSVPACLLLIFSKYMLNKWIDEKTNEWANNICISFWLPYSPFKSSWLHSILGNSFFPLIFSSQCFIQFLLPHPRIWVHSQLALGN